MIHLMLVGVMESGVGGDESAFFSFPVVAGWLDDASSTKVED